MKVFLPFKRDANRYLDEIENYFQGSFTYGNLDDYKPDYDIVNIHWPEALFNWKEPSDSDIEMLKSHIQKWKKKSKLVYTLHDEKSHKRKNEGYNPLFKLVFENADAIIHLGKYSFEKYLKVFSNAKHCIIQHPMYNTIANTITKKEARNILGIKSNQQVVLVFGSIRHLEEQKLILKTFKKLKTKNTTLLVAKFPFFTPKIIPTFFKEYYRSMMFRYYKLKKAYLFHTEFVETNQIQFFLNASDIVFIVRIDTLNSGNIPLALTFKKIAVGPNIGNMGCLLSELEYPKFDPTDTHSIVQSLKNGIEMSQTNKPEEIYLQNSNNYHPKKISDDYYSFFKSLTN